MMASNEGSVISKGFLFKNGNYEVINQIGEGGFGIVFLVKNKQSQEKYALKLLRNTMVSENEMKDYLKEIEYLKEFKNQYLVKYVENFMENQRPCVITTFYKDGDLDSLIESYKKKNNKFKTTEVFSYSEQILNGLDYLHKKDIVHRDIKPKNIFRNGDLLVIGDLGLAKKFDQIRTSTKLAGSINYISPECIENDTISIKSDIWSFGCVFYELFELKKAFTGSTEFQTMNKIVNGEIPDINKASNINSILQKCLSRNASQRPTSNDLIMEISNNNEKSRISSATRTKVSLNKSNLEDGISQMKVRESQSDRFGKLLRSLVGHKDLIYSLAYLQNGYLASCSSDKTIKIWNTQNGSLVKNLEKHTAFVQSVVHINGRSDCSLASASDDGTVNLWSWNKEKCIKSLEDHNYNVKSLAYKENGNLASGSYDDKIKIWDLNDMRCVRTLDGGDEQDCVFSLTFLDINILASGSESHNIIKIWDTRGGKLIRKLEGHKGCINSLVGLNNGMLASASWDKTIKIWSINDGKLIESLEGHKGVVHSLAVINKDYLASGGGVGDKQIKLWNINDGISIKTIENVHKDDILSLAYLENGCLASCSKDKTINIWDVNL